MEREFLDVRKAVFLNPPFENGFRNHNRYVRSFAPLGFASWDYPRIVPKFAACPISAFAKKCGDFLYGVIFFLNYLCAIFRHRRPLLTGRLRATCLVRLRAVVVYRASYFALLTLNWRFSTELANASYNDIVQLDKGFLMTKDNFLKQAYHKSERNAQTARKETRSLNQRNPVMRKGGNPNRRGNNHLVVMSIRFQPAVWDFFYSLPAG
jgi:hypothetical protein